MNFAINTNKFNLCHLPVTTSHFTTTTILLYFSTATKTRKDYYKILGVSRGSTPEQIKEAFYRLSKKYHPDVNQDKEKASKNFHKVSEAYEVLGSKEKRLAYDSLNAEMPTRIYKTTTHPQRTKTEKWEKDWSGFQNMNRQVEYVEICWCFPVCVKVVGPKNSPGFRLGFSVQLRISKRFFQEPTTLYF
uniref:J domain-containing protein n=1 Tax=Meloidogyne javanica TaxID=6303 RepID=A0A915MAP6_MELJA